MSCDAAKMTFSFLPKMMDQDDLSHDFGVTGLTGNTGSGNYEYSHGFGTTGQDRVQYFVKNVKSSANILMQI